MNERETNAPGANATEPMLVLSRDGVEVMRGRWARVAEWVHQRHCFSLAWACKYEGYEVSEASEAHHSDPRLWERCE